MRSGGVRERGVPNGEGDGRRRERGTTGSRPALAGGRPAPASPDSVAESDRHADHRADRETQLAVDRIPALARAREDGNEEMGDLDGDGERNDPEEDDTRPDRTRKQPDRDA